MPYPAKVKLEVINLICFLVIKAKRKITSYQLLVNHVYKDQPDMQNMTELVILACICDDLVKDCEGDDFNNYGYKDAKSILARLKTVLDNTLPF